MAETERRPNCSYCDHESTMKMENLVKNVTKYMCNKHFGDFVTQGKSKLMQEFLDKGGIPGMFGWGQQLENSIKNPEEFWVNKRGNVYLREIANKNEAIVNRGKPRKKTLYHTKFTVSVLSEEPIDPQSLSDLAYEIQDGDAVGSWWQVSERKVEGKTAVNLIYRLDSHPDYFLMDDQGNEEEV